MPSNRGTASTRAGRASPHRQRERQRRWVTGHGSGLQRQQQPHVGDRRRERAERRQVDPVGDGLAADHAVRRLEPRQSAERRGDPDRASAVGGVAIAAMPDASAAPEPPLDPPGDQSVPHGFVVVPYSAFVVNPANANSGWFVLPTTIAPAARSLRGTRPSARAAGGVRRTSANRTSTASPPRPPCPSPGAAVRRAARVLARRDPRVHRASVVDRLSRTRITALSGRVQALDPSEDSRPARSPTIRPERTAAAERPPGSSVRHDVADADDRPRPRFRSFSTTVDALRPGTPITPPPGCVPPPQR